MYANGKQKMVAWVGGGFVNRTWTFSTKQNKTEEQKRTEKLLLVVEWLAILQLSVSLVDKSVSQ